MLNFFNENILPLSEELQEMLDLQELKDDKIRSDTQAEIDELNTKRKLEQDCD